MTNKEIASIFKLTAKLMDLHGENEFKVKSFVNAAFRIDRLETELSLLTSDEIDTIEGIGKGILSKIKELNETGHLQETIILLEKTPEGIVHMMNIKGIGPKKAGIIWKQMGIETMGELLYACNENRLVEVKGFGEKTQAEIKKAIEFTISNAGIFHYAALESLTNHIIDNFKSQGASKVSAVGEMRRQCEVVSRIDILIAWNFKLERIKFLIDMGFKPYDKERGVIINEDGVRVKIHWCTDDMYNTLLVAFSGSEPHIELLKELGFNPEHNYIESEEEIYQNLGLQFIPSPMREGLDEIKLATENQIPDLIKEEDIKGVLHCHSTYSDGLKSLAIMAIRCKELGYEYLGITDHSQTAVYANGLKPERIKEQHKEIDDLNKRLNPFHIFKGIESDILGDGSLDYDDSILSTFDFVIASIHSNLKMSEDKATQRLLKAIENPFTTILGHPTGRLLLAREGYPIDHKTIIDACSKHKVFVELNANPLRLDLDWRWIRYAINKNVMISINPDAHSLEGIEHIRYGVKVAQKAGLNKEMTLNHLDKNQISDYFKHPKT
ncbi:MAG: helix-hairpin-helix domain-containing protein [Bacteroidota bacterium]